MQESNSILCDPIQTRIFEIYDFETGQKTDLPPADQSHLKTCSSCYSLYQDYQLVHQRFESLPEIDVPPALSLKVLSQLEIPHKKSGFFSEWLNRLILHPVSVAAVVFVFTLVGVYVYQGYLSSPSSNSVAQQTLGVSPNPDVAYAPAPMPTARFSNFHMSDWNPNLRLIPDLDRPVLSKVDVSNLDQATTEAVASFKHQLALRHMIDGDYAAVCGILDQVVENDMNYSQWDQAVILHMRVLKKLGRTEEVKKDLSRLKEYALASPEILSEFEVQ